jgi:LPXTG-motif cell wall-anchored protein
MLNKLSFTRVAATSVAGLVVALGSIGPVQAESGKHAHGDAQAAGTNGRAHPEAHQHGAHDREGAKARAGRQAGRDSSQGATPRRHTPVTVCHLLGNGSYNLLTFDRRALPAHQAHGDLYPVPAGGCPEPAASESAAPERAHTHPSPQHQRVTVCHLLGNGSYHVISFDRHALRAHLAHGDLYPAPADGCPTAEQGSTGGPAAPGTTTDETTTTRTGVPEATRPPVVAGVELERSRDVMAAGGSPAPAAVLGTEAAAAAGRSASTGSATAGAQTASGPTSGVLPQTGAAPIAGALLTGFGLLAAGAVLVRRRSRTTA